MARLIRGESARRFRPTAAHVARELTHERHLKAIAFWSCFAGALVALVGLIGCIRSVDSGASAIGPFVLVVMGGGHVACGVSLGRFAAWARWLTLVLYALAFAASMFGAVALVGVDPSYIPAKAVVNMVTSLLWSGASVWALASPRAGTICDPDYRFVVHRDGRPARAWSSPFFWAPMIGLFVQLAVALLTR